MKQYLDLSSRILRTGRWVTNDRTGNDCLTVINADLEYDLRYGYVPVVTTRSTPWKTAIRELLGYLRGYDSAAQFRALKCKTWDANANENEAWLRNPNRKGPDDMGRVYGVQGRGWQKPDGTRIDQLKKVVDNLSAHKDDRGEIITYWNPGEHDLGCLRPCMHTLTFSILGDDLYLTAYQRSADVPLGLVFNMLQVAVLLRVMAQICDLKAHTAYHKIVNAHIYKNQIPLMEEQVWRVARKPPKLQINPDIKSLSDLETWVTSEDFELVGYEPHPAIEYPFSV